MRMERVNGKAGKLEIGKAVLLHKARHFIRYTVSRLKNDF
jgi:hypothetical protein